jgi:peptidyl-prolyl cis-trans isomerase C
LIYLKFLLLTAILALGATAQQRSQIPASTVVAEVEGKPMTAGELNEFVGAMGPQAASFFDRDPKEFTRQLALLLKLAKVAEAEKLDQKSPAKQRLEYARANVLTQTLLDQKMNALPVDEKMLQTYYDQHKADFTQMFAKMIRVGYGVDGKPRTDADAKAKIEDLAKQATAGTDFSTLAKENSDDGATREKGGDLPPITKSSSGLPPKIKAALTGLQPGGVSAPIQEQNAYYLFRMERTAPAPLDAVRPEIANVVRQESFRKWMDEAKSSASVKFMDETYFKPNPAAAPPQLPAGVAPPKPGTPVPPAAPKP